MTLSDAFQFRLFKSALVEQFFLLLGSKVGKSAALVTLLFMPRHYRLKSGDFLFHLTTGARLTLQQGLTLRRLFQAFHLVVDGGNLRLATLELTLRIQQVINRRNEIIMMHTTRQVT